MPEHVETLNHPHPENINDVVVSEKLREFMSKRDSMPDGANRGQQTDTQAVAETLVSLTCMISGQRGFRVPRHEADAGVRLAGGRVGEGPVADDFDASEDGSTLQPPYSSHFGDIF